MKSTPTMRVRRKQAQAVVQGHHTTPQQQGNSLIAYIDSIAHGIKEFITQPLKEFVKAVEAHAGILKWLIPLQWRVAYQLAAWVINDVERKLISIIMRYVDQLKAWTFKQLQDVYYVLAVAIATLRAQVIMLVRAEVKSRVRDVKRAEAQAKAEVKALHHLIEREAATGYHSGNPGHLSAVSALGDAISAAEPVVRVVVERVIRYAIDLAEVDNPLLRFLATKLLSYVIRRLGIGKVAGEMLSSLVNPVAHMGAPRGLAEVVTMLCGRLNALEQFNATFMADGGPEILQAGNQWREIDSPATTIALAGFFGAMVADPNDWATVLADTIGTVVTDTISGAAKLMRG